MVILSKIERRVLFPSEITLLYIKKNSSKLRPCMVLLYIVLCHTVPFATLHCCCALEQTIAESVGDWYFYREAVKRIDCSSFPCNPTCHNMDFTWIQNKTWAPFLTPHLSRIFVAWSSWRKILPLCSLLEFCFNLIAWECAGS